MDTTRRNVLSGGLLGAGAALLTACDTGAPAGGRSRAAQTDAATAGHSHDAGASTPARWNATSAKAGARRQSGVVGHLGNHTHVLGIDLDASATRDDLRRALVVISDAAARLVGGGVPLTDAATEMAQDAGSLAITVGLGPRCFDLPGVNAAKPAWLAPIPPMQADEFEKPWRQSDIVVQVTSDNPMGVSHAATQIVESLVGVARIAWQQRGFRPPARRSDNGVMRNHFGQLDGQVNPSGTGNEADIVWNKAVSGSSWMQDSTGMVIRRIRMDVTTWDSLDREARENSIGRRLSNGAPLTGQSPNDPMDFTKKDSLGFAVIDPASHVARAMPAHGKPEQRILRQPYNYEELRSDGTSDKGLIFVAYCADIARQFVPIQKRLDEGDLLNTWTTAIGSMVYLVPPAPLSGEYVGQVVVEG